MTLVHLHRHSEYSFLDGIGTADHYAKLAAEMGQPALAITDHGNLCGSLHHIKACEAHGIQPIVGMEAYFRDDRLTHTKENYPYFHLVLLASGLEGWHSLMRLSTASFRPDSFYFKPVVDWDLLEQHHEGLIASTSCLSGFVPKAIMAGDTPRVQKLMEKLRDTFRDKFYVEIQPHDIDEQRLCNVELVNLAIGAGVPVVATADVHYPEKDWSDTHDVVMMMNTRQTTQTREDAATRGEEYMAFTGNTFYLMDRPALEQSFLDHHPNMPKNVVDEAIDNTNVIASWCKPFVVDKSQKVPKAADSPEDAELILRSWCEEGLVRIGKAADDAYRKQMEFELGVLRDKDVLNYFVVIGETVRWAKDKGIRVGPGRGSAAGSLVSYLCRITCIDPIGHSFLFERFINPAREGMPDIDIDFQHDRRAEVIEHLRDTYGIDHVANVAAFQTFGMRAALQRVARVLCIPYEDVMSVTKNFDKDAGAAGSADEGEVGLRMLFGVSEKLRDFTKKYPDAWKHALRLEGQVAAMGKHPAGVVVTDKPITEHMPTMRSNGGALVTAWSERANFPIISEYGFLKIDILSTDDLTIQAHAAALIRQHEGVYVDFESINMFPVIADPRAGDRDVIEAFGSGSNLGVFQFEGRGISGLLKDIKPEWLGDIIAANALFRPGPLDGGTTFSYAKRKNGSEPWQHFHPSVAEFLDETFGIIVYQEQVMQIVQAIGGLSMTEADFVRKAMTKWHSNKLNTRRGLERMTQFWDQVLEHATTKLGMEKKEVERVWDTVLSFSQYGFNKPHAGGYALEAYMDKWLLMRWPIYWYTSLLSHEQKKKGKVLREILARDLVVSTPDINDSKLGFTVSKGKIVFGLDAVKGCGAAVALEVSSKQPYTSWDDFKTRIERKRCNKAKWQALLSAGAFDRWGGRDKWMLDDKGEQVPGTMTLNEKAEAEKELLGFPLSSARSSTNAKLIKERVVTQDEIDSLPEGETVMVGGEITNIRELTTRKKQLMAFVDMEFENSEYSVTFFPRVYERVNGALFEGNTILVYGTVDDRRSVVANEFCTIETLKESLK